MKLKKSGTIPLMDANTQGNVYFQMGWRCEELVNKDFQVKLPISLYGQETRMVPIHVWKEILALQIEELRSIPFN